MNTQFLTAVLALGTLLAVPGVASAAVLDSAIKVDGGVVSGAGCLSPNVPDCIDYAAAWAKWASNTAGHLVCDILCDDDSFLHLAFAAAN